VSNAEVSRAKTPTYPVGTIAKLLLISERRVQQLTRDGVIPRADRGRYELAPAVQGYIRFLQERTIGGGNSGPIDYHAEKARLTKAQADTAEIELARARGEVAPVAEFEKATTRLMAIIRANVMNVPARAVLQLLGETDESTFKQRLRAELALALEQAAQADIDLDEEEEEGVPNARAD
jgi:phage terminase Nu1 subunit (DNA packaging protein)